MATQSKCYVLLYCANGGQRPGICRFRHPIYFDLQPLNHRQPRSHGCLSRSIKGASDNLQPRLSDALQYQGRCIVDYPSAGYDACREQTNARRPHCSARCVMRQCAPCGTHVSITVVLVAPCQYPVAPCQQWPIIKYSVPGRPWPRAWLRVRARARLNATQLFPRPSSTLVGAEVRLSLPSLLSRVTKVAAR